MKKMMAALLACSITVSMLAAGCGSSGDTGSTGNAGDTGNTGSAGNKEINILMEEVPDTTIVQNQIAAFEEETGIKVNIETIGYSSMHEKLLTQMIGASNAYDVVVVDCYWVGEFTTAGWLEDLGPYIEKSGFDTSQYVDSMMNMVGQVDGVTYMIPFYNYMMSLIYRTDIFEDETLRADYQAEFGTELTMPEDLEGYVELCKWITAQNYDYSGVVMQGARPDPTVVEWANYLFSCGGDFYDADGNITINSEEAVRALDLYVDCMKNSAPEGSKNFNLDEAFNVFAQGDAFSFISYNWMIPKLDNESESSVAGLSELVPIPKGSSLNAGWGWGIPTNAPDKESAWEFIQWIESAEITKERALEGGSPTRTDVMNDPEVLEKWPYLETVCEIMEDSKMFPIMEDATQLVEVLGREISLAVAGDQTSQEALDNVSGEMAGMQ